jgi:N-acetylglucosamine-6-sulfatase
MRRPGSCAPIPASQRIVLGCAALLVVSGLGVASSPSIGGPARARAVDAVQPNIVLIQADDQTFSQFTRKVMPKTKRLLARHGTSFTDYIATTAQCCPSRASFLTGQYAHNHGVTSNNVGYGGLVDKGNVLPVWLKRAGYRTAHVGKFMNGYTQATGDPAEVAPGWDDWQTLFSGSGHYYDYYLSNNGRTVHFGKRNRDYVTRVLERKAVQIIKRRMPAPQPLYLQLDERAPHLAGGNRPGRCGGIVPEPDPRDIHRFAGAPVPSVPSFNERDMRDKPAFLSSAPKLGRSQRVHVKKHWRCALASLVGVDRSVSRVYHVVAKTGELNKTVFIFISDNGQFYGEHRVVVGKVLPYEEALHLPLVIKAPKPYLGGAPRVKQARRPTGNIDLAPTILDLAHAQPCPQAEPCRTMDGRSLMPLLTGSGGWSRQRGLLTEFRKANAGRYATCQFAGIRTQSTIYVEHSRVVDPKTLQCVAADQRERYDLRKDPFELHNRCFGGIAANCPASAAQDKLEARLSRLSDCAGIAGRDHHVNGRPFCE